MPKQKVSWEHLAAKAWPILTKTASEKGHLYYSQLEEKIGIHHRSVRLVLEVIQRYCLDTNLPPLTAIVVGKQRGVPGSGFVGWDRNDLSAGLALVYSENWSEKPNPFEAFEAEDTIAALAQELLRDPSAAGEVYRRVRDRGVAQLIFREGLLQAYDHRCAMCDLSFVDALQAAHIVPFAECSIDQRIDIRNGLLLCANHHRLYDGDWFSISTDYRIVFSDPKMDDGPYTSADKAASTHLHGKKLRLPADPSLWPNFENEDR